MLVLFRINMLEGSYLRSDCIGATVRGHKSSGLSSNLPLVHQLYIKYVYKILKMLLYDILIANSK